MTVPAMRTVSCHSRSPWPRAAALAIALGCGGWAVPAAAQVSADKAAQDVARTYGVEVLRVRPGEVGIRAVWFVTVMNSGGNFNEAFQVTTLAVDRASGELLPAFRHGLSGSTGNAEAVDMRGDRRPDAARSGTWR